MPQIILEISTVYVSGVVVLYVTDCCFYYYFIIRLMTKQLKLCCVDQEEQVNPQITTHKKKNWNPQNPNVLIIILFIDFILTPLVVHLTCWQIKQMAWLKKNTKIIRSRTTEWHLQFTVFTNISLIYRLLIYSMLEKCCKIVPWLK